MERVGQVQHGESHIPLDEQGASGRLVRAFGEECYVIEDAQALPPFLTLVASDSDHWLFISSNGGLTAGRRSPATALFPYVTEDRLADSPGVTGPVTALVATREGRSSLWHPLREGDRLVYRCRRRLYKSVLGARLVLEEENLDLGLCFRMSWRTSERYGFVRECSLVNQGAGPVAIRLLDGLLNLLPGDAHEQLQQSASVLLDAYKQAERLGGTSLAVFTLAAQVVDLPEPREALHATTVWSQGLPDSRLHLAAEALPAFVRGTPRPARDAERGQRGAYLLEAESRLGPGEALEWLLVADVARTQADVALLLEQLRQPEALVAALREDIARGTARLEQLLATTDGQQLTGDRIASAHHLSNVLYNDMRGGVFAHGTAIPGPDFTAFVRAANRAAFERHAATLAALPALEPREAHHARVEALGDADLARLSAEYLPLFFSRRHGDPSRPWNRFNIRVKDERGAPLLDYQGNWRDIFQNWEALSRSFPGFVEQIIAKFVNASTVDGHNPYRIGRDGIDWEVPEPDHPWASIGYWGDHQLVYLLRLLELSLQHHPGALEAWLERPLFTYADVPYEIRPYADMVADPRNSIRFDVPKHQRLLARARELGSDGRLLHDSSGLVRVTLVEKLLVPALAKVASFVPGGGIWMNTQRPEWNDANNALVGYGVSMVTLCYLERYLEVLEGLLAPLAGRRTPLSREVADWLAATSEVLRTHRVALERGEVEDTARGTLMAALGTAASEYRGRVYRQGFSGWLSVEVDALRGFASRCRAVLRRTLAGARREDGLFHAYNVLVPRGGGAFGLQHLEEMLEGQVAALSTRAVDDEQACALLEALPRSRLYRADQRSYLLYPDRRLPGFLEKNIIPEEMLPRAPALVRLLEAGDGQVVLRDAAGRLRFHGRLHNAVACAAALRERLPGLGEEEVASALEVYEAVFHHRAFTGRSGTMFAYEGLGSIYWHMVGKLLLAVQERYFDAVERGASAEVVERLGAAYEAIREGMGGAGKSPAEWGAFPLDAYSHTPGHGGARQPGMTGQVKEEFLIRLGELGVRVQGGRLGFRPSLLRRTEFLTTPALFEPIGVDESQLRMELEAGSLAFTVCQVPVVYHLGEAPRLEASMADGSVRRFSGDTLDEATSAAVFQRDGRVRRIDAWVQPGR